MPSALSSRQPERVQSESWPSVSVVICVYTEKRWDDILSAIASVRDQNYPGPLETLVVVDHNPDLLERLESLDGDFRVLPSEGTRGLAGGRNTGISHASGEVIVFLDDDASAAPGWLRHLVEPYADDAVIATGGWIRPLWTSERPRWFPPEFDWVIGCSYVGLPEEVADVRNVIGASMSFRSRSLERAGRFSEGLGRVGTLPLGCEETEICIRARQAIPGARVVHVPASVVDHRVTDDRLTFRYFFHRCWSEGISKGAVAQSVGTGAALESERRYSSVTLPKGVLRGASEGLKGDPYGPVRSGVIIAGLLVTVMGYLRGRRAAQSGFQKL